VTTGNPEGLVAIERAINKEIERQAGGRGQKLDQKIGQVSPNRTNDEAARLSGFGNRETARH
jgi:hypothetical protein